MIEIANDNAYGIVVNRKGLSADGLTLDEAKSNLADVLDAALEIQDAELTRLRAELENEIEACRIARRRQAEISAELEKARAALKPVAALYKAHHFDQPGAWVVFAINDSPLTINDLRAARAALAPVASGEKEEQNE